MAVIYFAYLFDDEAFRQAVFPLVPQLEAGNYEALHQLAKETMERKPHLWSVLDNLFLGPPFAEEGEQLTPRRMLTMVLAQFLQPIAEFNVAEGLPFLEATLQMIGWREEETKLLIHGQSLCELLVPGKYHLSEYKNRPQDLPWCIGYVGWLDKDSVIRLKNRMEQSRESYRSFVKETQEVKRAESVWENITQILTLAHESQKALAIAAAW